MARLAQKGAARSIRVVTFHSQSFSGRDDAESQALGIEYSA